MQIHPNYNADITKILKGMCVVEKNLGHAHKAKAYETAIASLSAYPTRVSSASEAQKLNGIGVKIGKKIEEILSTGRLNKLDKLLDDPKIRAVNLLCRVSGVGPIAALKWVEQGVMTLEDLARQKLTHHQQIGLKYFEDFEKRIPRSEMVLHNQKILEIVKSIDPNINLKLCGSFRRGQDSSGDIDILCSHPEFCDQNKEKKQSFGIITKMVDGLTESGYIIDNISKVSNFNTKENRY
eukprot:TRINITY_DN4003_c0_g1_i18.p1 TRINITY_DN4003_c0_g1~~TRINITY_DN4003_c0_g1_i18.p1  ORF type:complete len:276 (+),score=60.55 TRINITY_DN4003_c0_g1_i18:116-829(+)